jgi:hypothetical protein
MGLLIPVSPVGTVPGVWIGVDGMCVKTIKGGIMQKYFTNLKDYKCASKHPLRDKIICNVRMTLIFLVSMTLMLAVCGALEVM